MSAIIDDCASDIAVVIDEKSKEAMEELIDCRFIEARVGVEVNEVLSTPELLKAVYARF